MWINKNIIIFSMVVLIISLTPTSTALMSDTQENNIFPNVHDTDVVLNNASDDFTNGSKTIYVAQNGVDQNDGLTPDRPKRNIENAISNAQPGDTIQVGPGTYTESISINKNLTLTGNTQTDTIICGQGGNCVVSYANVTATITGFTIKNGTERYGGGIRNNGYMALYNVTITNNTSQWGGGIYNKGDMFMQNVMITKNTAKNGDPSEGCGGGLYTEGHINMYNVTFTDNTADRNCGGLYNCGTTGIENGTISNNTANLNGGGIYNRRSTLKLNNCTISNNTANLNGGGLYNQDFGYVILDHCTLCKNTVNMDGGGIFNEAYFVLINCLVIDNAAKRVGGGICNTIRFYVESSIIMNNKAGDDGGISNFSEYSFYLDELSQVKDNSPNDYGGYPFKP